MTQKRSYSSEIFLEPSSFQNNWKKKIWFFVQCIFTFRFTRFPNKSFISSSTINRFLTFASTFIIIPSLFIITIIILLLHLQVWCNFIYLVSLVLDIRLNALTFMFLTTSDADNFEYGSLILLQLPLHLHYSNTIRIKCRFITVDIYYFRPCFSHLIIN